MKTRHIVALAVVAVAAAGFLAGCGFLGTSIDARISSFASDLNSSPANAYTNLEPDSSPYNLANGDASFWDTSFPAADGPWTATITSTQPYDGTAGVNVDMVPTKASATTKHCVFFLVDTGSLFEDYYISDIQINGTTIFL